MAPFSQKLEPPQNPGRFNQVQHGRMQRVVQMRDRVVGAVDRERVLDQVVRADRQEIEALQKQRQRDRGGRNFDHRADAHVRIVREPRVVELALRFANQVERLVDLLRMREHRDQDLHLTERRRAQDRAQLREKHLRLGQAPANRAQPERRVRRGFVAFVERFERLVRADVDRADRDGHALHPLDRTLVRGELLLLFRHLLLMHEQEFGAKQPDADRARVDRRLRVVGQLDVRVQRDRRAAQGLRRRELQALQLALLEQLLRLPVRIFLEHDRRRIDDHDALIAVDDDEIVLPDQRARMLHADGGRNAEAARDDRRMRRAAAEIGDERLERLRLELHHVGRRDVVRDDDHLARAVRRRAVERLGGRRCARERLQHALDDLLDVGLALAQIFVFDVVEVAREQIELFGQRPFDVVATRADQVDRFLDEHRVAEDHRVHVDECADFGRRVVGQVGAQCFELAMHGVERRAEALDLGLDPVRLDQVMGDVERRRRDQIRSPDRDTT
ncbi:hypothetical protein FEP29_03782 [Burkholderia multivorans]|nr:hypothetical protein [Burkholderia multivorans]